MHRLFVIVLALLVPGAPVRAEATATAPAPSAEARPTVADPALAARLGADERGMRGYVLVILKTGPKRMPDGDERKAMFAGHFANIGRLAKAGKLAVAGPFETDPDQWRGLFLFAVDSIEEAKALVATDPVIINGEMVAEYHRWYASAALMQVPEIHERIAPKSD